MRALIVDDSSTMRSVLRMILRGLGMETLEAGNGALAIQQLQQPQAVDFVLVDWNMPVMSGFEFLCALRADHNRDQMKVLMVTTETELTQVQHALECGANEYIMKPFTRDSVIEKLQILGLVPQAA
jgi:two-component system chemotaxis response regulator CheY